MKIKLYYLTTVLLFLVGWNDSFCQKPIFFSDTLDHYLIGKSILLLEDKKNEFELETVLDSSHLFKENTIDLISLGLSSSSFWLKFNIQNNTSLPYLILVIDQPSLDFVELYTQDANHTFSSLDIGEHKKFRERKYQHPVYLFDLDLAPHESATFYLKVKGDEPIVLPISLETPQDMVKLLSNKDMVMGIYLGVMLVMIFYNLFIYITVRDANYLFYIIYLGFICIAQTSIQGYTFKYLWPEIPLFSKYSVFIFAPVATISAIFFVNKFLQTAVHIKRTYKALNFIIGLFLVSIFFSLAQQFQIAYQIINVLTLSGVILTLIGGVVVYKKGVQSARFFILGWSILLICGLIYSLKEMGILPHVFFTAYSIQIGSALEAILLSFALGDKINTYKKERLAAVLEKEQLLTEQNVMLERKVKNRTEELDTTLNELKSTQSQLVQSEKMASIGLLTAGIAHEINNPLNYMLQNVEILKEDMVDVKGLIAQYEEVNASNVQQKIAAIGHFKKKIQLESIYQEIDRSLADIADGIHRTETITQGLKTFSRLDESNYKETNIEENIDNTLQFIKHELIKNKILIKKVYGETRNVGCNPGKLNQVFMNLFINAIYAIKARADKTIPGQLEVKTEIVGAKFVISVKDNGCGMSEKTKSKLFDPFYTTKDVGEGTGLGMSIVHGIILDHKGSIHVESILNKGSKISIHLPLN